MTEIREASLNISLVKRNNIGFYAGGYVWPPSLDIKGLSWIHIFLGTIKTFFFLPLEQYTTEEHKGKTSRTFQSRNIFVVDAWDSSRAPAGPWRAWFPAEREKKSKNFVKRCIISISSDMQADQNIFYFSEHMSVTHGFCKPLLCGCIYCYFVYWNKEISIYKISHNLTDFMHFKLNTI